MCGPVATSLCSQDPCNNLVDAWVIRRRSANRQEPKGVCEVMQRELEGVLGGGNVTPAISPSSFAHLRQLVACSNSSCDDSFPRLVLSLSAPGKREETAPPGVKLVIESVVSIKWCGGSSSRWLAGIRDILIKVLRPPSEAATPLPKKCVSTRSPTPRLSLSRW